MSRCSPLLNSIRQYKLYNRQNVYSRHNLKGRLQNKIVACRSSGYIVTHIGLYSLKTITKCILQERYAAGVQQETLTLVWLQLPTGACMIKCDVVEAIITNITTGTSRTGSTVVNTIWRCKRIVLHSLELHYDRDVVHCDVIM